MPPTGLCFAYGSNLDVERMRRRAPSARVAGVAWLPEHRVLFGAAPGLRQGVATVVPASGSDVWGLLWEVDDEALARLDRYEAFPAVYGRTRMTVRAARGDVANVWVYALKGRPVSARANRDHLNVMKRAAARWGFPRQHREELVALGRPSRRTPPTTAPLSPRERRGPTRASGVGGSPVRRRKVREMPDWFDALEDV